MGNCITRCEKNEALCCSDDCFLRVVEGSRLRDLKYNNISRFCNGLSIYDGEKEVACGFIGEVLRSVVPLVDREIESCNTFFDVFVIRLKKK